MKLTSTVNTKKKHPCVNWWSLFGDVAASISFDQVPYATINTIYCGVGGMNKGYWCSDIPKKGSQNSTSICQFFWKILHASDVDNKALVITPLAKLFHYILNMIYLLLVRFGIGLLICISPLIVHLPRRDVLLLLCTSAEFPQWSKFFRTKFFQLPDVCASCWSLCCWWWWGGGWSITIFISIVERSFCCCSCTFASKLVSSHNF